MLKGAFHQGLGGGMSVLFQQLFVQAAAVDADADGDVLVLAHLHHGLDPILPADVAGVDADFGGTALRRQDGKLVVKMDVRHQGQGAFPANLREAPGGLPIGHRQTDDLAAGSGQLLDLL